MHNLALTTQFCYKTSPLTQNWTVSWASGQSLLFITLGKLQSPSVFTLCYKAFVPKGPTLCLSIIQLKSISCKETYFLKILHRVIQLCPFTGRESALFFSHPTLDSCLVHLCMCLPNVWFPYQPATPLRNLGSGSPRHLVYCLAHNRYSINVC